MQNFCPLSLWSKSYQGVLLEHHSVMEYDESPPSVRNRIEALFENEWIRPPSEIGSNDGNVTQSSQKSESTRPVGKPKKKRRNTEKRSITIAGDSMLRDVKKWHFQNVTSDNVYVKCFPSATTSDIWYRTSNLQ